MRRTIAAAGLLGLGLLGITIPAVAEPGNGQGNQEKVCHENNAGGNGNGGENGNAGGNGNGGENGNALSLIHI